MALKSWAQMQADSQQRAAERRQKALDKLARGEKLGWAEQGLVKNRLEAAKADQLPMEKLGGRTSKLLAGTLGRDETVLGQMNGNFDNQTLVITDQRVLIIKAGFMMGPTLGGKVISFAYPNITAVEVRSSRASGVFEISTPGMQGSEKSVYDFSKKGSAQSGNAILILKKQVPNFQQAANVIREQIRKGSTRAPAASSADEIRKLAELRDSGIGTEAEF
jgi:hypothetical protein